MALKLFIKSKIQLKNIPGDSISIKFSNKLVIISQFIAQEKETEDKWFNQAEKSLLLPWTENIWGSFRHIFKLLHEWSRDIF